MNRTKPINPFLLKLMELHGLETLGEAADYLKMHRAALHRFADIDGDNKFLEAHIKAAEGFGIPLDEWVYGILDRKMPKKPVRT